MNDIHPLDIWHAVFQHCDLWSQLRLISVCADFYHSFFIIDLYNIPETYRNKLTDLVLRQRKFSRLVQLDIQNNKNVYNISFLTTLKKLRIGYLCGIEQQGIHGLDLIELYTGCNTNIKNVSLMTNLKILHARGSQNIDQRGIQGLNLIELDACYNEQIKDVSFMSCRN